MSFCVRTLYEHGFLLKELRCTRCTPHSKQTPDVKGRPWRPTAGTDRLAHPTQPPLLSEVPSHTKHTLARGPTCCRPPAMPFHAPLSADFARPRPRPRLHSFAPEVRSAPPLSVVGDATHSTRTQWETTLARRLLGSKHSRLLAACRGSGKCGLRDWRQFRHQVAFSKGGPVTGARLLLTENFLLLEWAAQNPVPPATRPSSQGPAPPAQGGGYSQWGSLCAAMFCSPGPRFPNCSSENQTPPPGGLVK